MRIWLLPVQGSGGGARVSGGSEAALPEEGQEAGLFLVL